MKKPSRRENRKGKSKKPLPVLEARSVTMPGDPPRPHGITLVSEQELNSSFLFGCHRLFLGLELCLLS